MAERRFNDVRELANSVLFELPDDLADLPRSTSIRDKWMKKAISYLDTLSEESGNNQALRYELALAYGKVAQVQGGGEPYSTNLGDFEGALHYPAPLEKWTTDKTFSRHYSRRWTMEQGQDKTPQRWTAKRRAALVIEILRGDTSAQEAARQHGLIVAEVEQWKERFLAGAENALRSRPLDEEEMKDREIKRLKQKIATS